MEQNRDIGFPNKHRFRGAPKVYPLTVNEPVPLNKGTQHLVGVSIKINLGENPIYAKSRARTGPYEGSIRILELCRTRFHQETSCLVGN